MSSTEIADLSTFLRSVVNDGHQLVDYHVTRLTSPGENYGSVIWAIEITVRDKAGDDTKLNVAAKMIPPNDFLQRLFNIQTTFKNEIELYRTVIPTLQEFQKLQGMRNLIDITPKYYGSRFSLNSDSLRIDDDAVLLLENLKFSGFVTVDRFVGCDLEMSRLVMKALAKLHAVPIGLKLLEPKVFEKKIKPHLTCWGMEIVAKDLLERFVKKITNAVASIDVCAPYLDRVRAVLSLPPKREPREPFATVVHNDCWSNNTMVRFNDNNVPVAIKVIDFQVVEYGSPAKDLLFFLFTSIAGEICESHCDELIDLYYATFIDILEELRCDVTPFTFEALQKELAFEARNSQFLHVAWMLDPICARKDKVKDITEVKEEDFANSEVNSLAKEKLSFMVTYFSKRDWI